MTALSNQPAADQTVSDQEPWTEIATPPRSTLRAGLARQWLLRSVRALPLTIVLPDGRRFGGGGKDDPTMHIHRPSDFFRRLGVHGKMGLGEGYMAGDWTSDRLADLLTAFAERMGTVIPARLRVVRRWLEPKQPPHEENTIEGAKSNIHRHYDLSNDLFQTFLDETMTYSSAWFEPGSQDLHAGQVRKIDGVLDYADVRSGSHVLEIGTGWGALAMRAARRGARVTTLTISEEQKKLAEERISAAGLSDRIEVLLQDYRNTTGSYDAAVSVEMIEAVGERYLPDYFATVDRVLKPGGRFGLQAITMPHDRLLATKDAYTWIHKYIFPGGMFLSPELIDQVLARHTRMKVHAFRDFGHDYANTLRQWRERFLAGWKEVAALGFDETFGRMWEFYLAYCEAGFRSRHLGVRQLSIGT